MHVVIIGAGEVGTSIAESLDDSHDVVVIDVDEARAEELTYGLDVMTLAGDGTHSAVLREADIESADMLIASTDDDRTNLVACGTATALADPFTIARTKSVEYLSTWEERESAFGVDFMVCSDLSAAENIVRVVGLPAAIDVNPFAGGQVQMAVFDIHGDSPVAGQTVAEADRFDARVRERRHSDARQHRARLRLARPVRELPPVPELLEAPHDRPDVVRPAEYRARPRAAGGDEN